MQDYVAQFIESPSFKPKGLSFDFLDWGVLYPVNKGLSFAWLLAFTKSFASLFTKQTRYATDKRMTSKTLKAIQERNLCS